MHEPCHKTLAPYFLQGMQCCTQKCYHWAAIPESAQALEHVQQPSTMPELMDKPPPLSVESVLLFNVKSALQKQLNCSSGLKYSFHILQCHADTGKLLKDPVLSVGLRSICWELLHTFAYFSCIKKYVPNQ